MTLGNAARAAEGKMKGFVFGLVLPLLAACAGKNTVAGSDKTKAEQLHESLPSWCQSTCARLKDCASGKDCTCSGDVCNCPTVNSDCEASCEKELATFSSSEACAEVGQRFQHCIDTATCAAIYDEACDISKADEKLCGPVGDSPSSDGGGSVGSPVGGPVPNGPSTGGASSDDSGSNGTGGSTSGTSGGTGMGGGATGGTGMSGGATGDPEPTVTCEESGSTGTAPGSSNTTEICEGVYLGCSDGHEYRYLCARTQDGRSACSCLVDDQVTGAFDPGMECPGTAALDVGCNWGIAGI